MLFADDRTIFEKPHKEKSCFLTVNQINGVEDGLK